MNTRASIVVLLAVAGACAGASPRRGDLAEDWSSHASIAFAGRTYDGQSFGNIEDGGAMGLEFDLRPAQSPFGGEIGLAASFGGGLGEVYFGPRVTLADDGGPGFRPYLGAGGTIARAELDRLFDAVVTPSSDTSFGGYVHGGAYYRFEGGLSLGLDARSVFGTDFDAPGFSDDADYFQVGLTFGSGF